MIYIVDRSEVEGKESLKDEKFKFIQEIGKITLELGKTYKLFQPVKELRTLNVFNGGK